MALFGKRVVVYRVQGDKPAWKAARETLMSAGIKIMESGSYDGEMPICGCGAKIDRRNYGPGGWIEPADLLHRRPAGGRGPGKGHAGADVK